MVLLDWYLRKKNQRHLQKLLLSIRRPLPVLLAWYLQKRIQHHLRKLLHSIRRSSPVLLAWYLQKHIQHSKAPPFDQPIITGLTWSYLLDTYENSFIITLESPSFQSGNHFVSSDSFSFHLKFLFVPFLSLTFNRFIYHSSKTQTFLDSFGHYLKTYLHHINPIAFRK
jgi:hypothetical protein